MLVPARILHISRSNFRACPPAGCTAISPSPSLSLHEFLFGGTHQTGG